MRRTLERRRSPLRFNITPLIDVVFLLIIFFLVASHIARSSAQEPVELPDAVSVEPDRPAPHLLVITISEVGTWTVRGQAQTLNDINARLKAMAAEHGGDVEVRIRGHRTSVFRDTEPLLLACAANGITRVKFAVEKAPGAKETR